MYAAALKVDALKCTTCLSTHYLALQIVNVTAVYNICYFLFIYYKMNNASLFFSDAKKIFLNVK